MIRFADHSDYSWLKENDKHVSENLIRSKIENKEILIASNGNRLGWLRYNLFWDNIPFMNMLFIIEEYRNMGLGKQLVEYWECEMKNKGNAILMLSTLANEDAQHFYRKLGYSDIGGFVLPNSPMEIIMSKRLDM